MIGCAAVDQKYLICYNIRIYAALDIWRGHHPFKMARGDRNPLRCAK